MYLHKNSRQILMMNLYDILQKREKEVEPRIETCSTLIC